MTPSLVPDSGTLVRHPPGAVPIMAVMMRMAVRPDIMGPFTIRRRLHRLGWIATALMAIAVVGMIVSMAS